MRAPRRTVLLAALALLAPGAASASAGALDGNGCHYDRSKGNQYHCHKEAPPNLDRNATVKKSRENICHDKSSPNYRTIRYFVSYRSMTACVTSGGTEAMSTGGGLSGH
ncbi:MAG: hypothetical protein ABI821_10825 [Pseudomonadota bacterium]